MAIVSSPSPRVVRSFSRALPPAQKTRHTPRPAAPFGAGLLRSLPAYRAPYTASDAAWWAEQQATLEDCRFDRLAAEAEAQDRLESGTLL